MKKMQEGALGDKRWLCEVNDRVKTCFVDDCLDQLKDWLNYIQAACRGKQYDSYTRESEMNLGQRK